MKAKGENLGELEELVLLVTATLAEEAYGVSVMHYISQEAGRNVNISAIHEVLKRLERKGYVRSKMGGATATRGGRRKRYFLLTASGRRLLDEAIRLKVQLYSRLPNLSIRIS
jgi:PadR family transcriptional regulator PadR